MVGRKVLLIRNGVVFEEYRVMSDEDYWEELKRSLSKGLRVLGFVMLVGIIRLYVKTTNYLKSTYEIGKTRIKEIRARRMSKNGAVEVKPQEASKFLKMVGNYKRKIRRIKEKVKEEEGR